MSHERVSIGRLKARLSEYVRRARGGEAVVITDRGRPVARLSPLGASEAGLEGHLAGLTRAGLIRPPERRLDPAQFLAAERPRDSEGRALGSVLEERAEGW